MTMLVCLRFSLLHYLPIIFHLFIIPEVNNLKHPPSTTTLSILLEDNYSLNYVNTSITSVPSASSHKKRSREDWEAEVKKLRAKSKNLGIESQKLGID